MVPIGVNIWNFNTSRSQLLVKLQRYNYYYFFLILKSGILHPIFAVISKNPICFILANCFGKKYVEVNILRKYLCYIFCGSMLVFLSFFVAIKTITEMENCISIILLKIILMLLFFHFSVLRKVRTTKRKQSFIMGGTL